MSHIDLPGPGIIRLTCSITFENARFLDDASPEEIEAWFAEKEKEAKLWLEEHRRSERRARWLLGGIVCAGVIAEIILFILCP